MHLWLESKLTVYCIVGMYIKFRITTLEEECWLKQIRSSFFYFSWLIPLEDSFMVVLFDDKFVRVIACRNVVDERNMDRNKIQAEQKVHREASLTVKPSYWLMYHSVSSVRGFVLGHSVFSVILLYQLLKAGKKK